jgi:hypothetical protein
MKQETEYSGYRIVCRSAGRLFAQIFPPNSSKPLREVPVANHAEGMDYLLGLAKHAIDLHQASLKTGSAQARPN